ncbi:hypothetical protein ACIA58_12170 [Kribbella sp. NPDC051586]|uniref:hypothetical protein n=1 Tax=Kribbella sp. NPDC051586 TaxID=3364118 RepID=UPI0037AFED93
MDSNRPFRWDLIRPDQLGSLLDDVQSWELSFLDDLVRCAARVLGQCGDGDLYFVGRSVDSLFDLLSGALADTTWSSRLHPLPLSLFGTDGKDLSGTELRQLRANLTADGLAPAGLMRGRPTVFVDLVHQGSTFENLYAVLRRWIDDEHAQWDVIRRQFRFVGITARTKTSPNTRRWQQHADFAAELPSSAIRNVSLDARLWSYFGDYQRKTTASFRRTRWADPAVVDPPRDEASRIALAEAVRVVAAGRAPKVRRQLARLLTKEPAMSERWLRDLQVSLRR